VFNSFQNFFFVSQKVDSVSGLKISEIDYLGKEQGANEFFNLYEGCTFNNGLYRIHSIDKVNYWNSIVAEIFPNFKECIDCFGYDWLGRQFAVEKRLVSQSESPILIFDVGANLSLRVPHSFYNFHEIETVEYCNDVFYSDFFLQAKGLIDTDLPYDKCFYCETPIFLQGEYCIDNLKVMSMEVYWHIYGQILHQTI
jgi:Domain of unknown function (DUF1851)